VQSQMRFGVSAIWCPTRNCYRLHIACDIALRFAVRFGARFHVCTMEATADTKSHTKSLTKSHLQIGKKYRK
jgi:hypothetical protein